MAAGPTAAPRLDSPLPGPVHRSRAETAGVAPCRGAAPPLGSKAPLGPTASCGPRPSLAPSGRRRHLAAAGPCERLRRAAPGP